MAKAAKEGRLFRGFRTLRGVRGQRPSRSLLRHGGLVDGPPPGAVRLAPGDLRRHPAIHQARRGQGNIAPAQRRPLLSCHKGRPAGEQSGIVRTTPLVIELLNIDADHRRPGAAVVVENPASLIIVIPNDEDVAARAPHGSQIIGCAATNGRPGVAIIV